MLGDLDPRAVDADVVARRVRLGAELADRRRRSRVTRPSSIICSDARREAMPACDRIFCRRSITGPDQGVPRTRRLKTKLGILARSIVTFVALCLAVTWLSGRADRPRTPRAAARRRRASVGRLRRARSGRSAAAAPARGRADPAARYSDSTAGTTLSSRPCSRNTGAVGFGDFDTDSPSAAPLDPMQRQQPRAEVDDVALDDVAQQRAPTARGSVARELARPSRTPPARAPCRRRRRAPTPTGTAARRRAARSTCAAGTSRSAQRQQDHRDAVVVRRQDERACRRPRDPSWTSGAGRGSCPVQR